MLNFGNLGSLSSYIFHISLLDSLFSSPSPVPLIPPISASREFPKGSLLKWETFDRGKHFHPA
jgi:hypothetical protein